MKAVTKKSLAARCRECRAPTKGFVWGRRGEAAAGWVKLCRAQSQDQGAPAPGWRNGGGHGRNLSDHHHKTCSVHTGLGWVLQSQLLPLPGALCSTLRISLPKQRFEPQAFTQELRFVSVSSVISRTGFQ